MTTKRPVWTLTASLLVSLISADLAVAADGIVAVVNTAGAPLPTVTTRHEIVTNLRAPGTANADATSLPLGLVPGAAGGIASVPSGGVSGQAFGSFGIPYTATRVVLGSTGPSLANGGNLLSASYPYRAVGKLLIDGGYCSAALIRRAVIVTAAHCIEEYGSGSFTYSGWTFVPAYYGDGATVLAREPYGRYTWRAFAVPKTWRQGSDIGTDAARDNDLAVIALSRTDGAFPGDVAGYLAYGWNDYAFVASPRTGDLAVAATTTLGYPALIDRGEIMQRADGPSYLTTIGGAGQIWQGSNFTAGSSGGPWVVNFSARIGQLGGGATYGKQMRMAVVGVTSWGSEDPNGPKDNYSSQFRQNSAFPKADYGGRGAGNIGALLQTLCNLVSGGTTLAAQGYCG